MDGRADGRVCALYGFSKEDVGERERGRFLRREFEEESFFTVARERVVYEECRVARSALFPSRRCFLREELSFERVREMRF